MSIVFIVTASAALQLLVMAVAVHYPSQAGPHGASVALRLKTIMIIP